MHGPFMLPYRRCKPLDGVRLGNVDVLEADGSAGRGNLRGRATGELAQHVAQHESRPVSRASERDRAAHAAGGTCHDDRATFEHTADATGFSPWRATPGP